MWSWLLSVGCSERAEKPPEVTEHASFAEWIVEHPATLTDGSTVWLFEPDHKFRLEGCNKEKGRRVSGRWEVGSNSDTITIEGQWSWANGVGRGDRRRMRVIVYIYGTVPIHNEHCNVDALPAYFVVDELVAIESQ